MLTLQAVATIVEGHWSLEFCPNDKAEEDSENTHSDMTFGTAVDILEYLKEIEYADCLRLYWDIALSSSAVPFEEELANMTMMKGKGDEIVALILQSEFDLVSPLMGVYFCRKQHPRVFWKRTWSVLQVSRPSDMTSVVEREAQGFVLHDSSIHDESMGFQKSKLPSRARRSADNRWEMVSDDGRVGLLLLDKEKAVFQMFSSNPVHGSLNPKSFGCITNPRFSVIHTLFRVVQMLDDGSNQGDSKEEQEEGELPDFSALESLLDSFVERSLNAPELLLPHLAHRNKKFLQRTIGFAVSQFLNLPLRNQTLQAILRDKLGCCPTDDQVISLQEAAAVKKRTRISSPTQVVHGEFIPLVPYLSLDYPQRICSVKDVVGNVASRSLLASWWTDRLLKVEAARLEQRSFWNL